MIITISRRNVSMLFVDAECKHLRNKYEELVFLYQTNLKKFHVTFQPLEEFTDIHKYKEA